jgi:hypothetical protein
MTMAEHICKECTHFKAIIPGTIIPPEHLIGYCKAIHWPYFWAVQRDLVVTECKWFEKKK